MGSSLEVCLSHMRSGAYMGLPFAWRLRVIPGGLSGTCQWLPFLWMTPSGCCLTLFSGSSANHFSISPIRVRLKVLTCFLEPISFATFWLLWIFHGLGSQRTRFIKSKSKAKLISDEDAELFFEESSARMRCGANSVVWTCVLDTGSYQIWNL